METPINYELRATNYRLPSTSYQDFAIALFNTTLNK